MFIILPREGHDLKDVEKDLEKIKFSDLYKGKLETIELTLPKILELSSDLNDTKLLLDNDIANIILSSSADFSDIPLSGPFINIGRKLSIKVDRNGTGTYIITFVLFFFQ